MKSIPQTHFSVTECDHCADDVSDPSSNLKCMWVWESGIAEVGMLARIDGIAVNGLVNTCRSLVKTMTMMLAVMLAVTMIWTSLRYVE